MTVRLFMWRKFKETSEFLSVRLVLTNLSTKDTPNLCTFPCKNLLMVIRACTLLVEYMSQIYPAGLSPL